jgi:hypothetical protein
MLLDYSKLTHDEITSQLTSYLESKDSWRNLTGLSPTTNLIEVVSAVGELLIYLLERRAEELYPGTARFDSSVMMLAQGLNYNPRRKTAATTELEFILKDSDTQLEIEAVSAFTIPPYTRVESATNPGIIFITAEGINFNPGESRKTVTAYQGSILTKTFTSSGYPLQRFYINESNIDNTFFYVDVNSASWTVLLSLAESQESDKIVVARTLPAYSGVSLLFGDNVNGMIPPQGGTILVTMLITDGKTGNINVIGDINNLLDTITTPSNTFMTVSNITSASGGANEESIQSIKENASKVFVVAERSMISKNNWLYQMKKFPGIKQLNVFGEFDTNPTNPNQELANLVYLRILGELDSNGTPTKVKDIDGNLTQFGTNVLTYADKYKGITVRIDMEDAEIVDLIITINAIIGRDKNSSIVSNKIDAIINSNINYDTMSVGQPLYLSEIYKIIQGNVTELSHSFVNLQSYELGGTQDLQLANIYPLNTQLKNIKPLTFKLLLNDVLIAEDDGNGNLVATTFTPIDNPATPPSATLNGTTGGITEGTFKYKTVFIADNIGHSTPSSVSNTVTIDFTVSAWSSIVTYNQGDSVSYLGSNYICLISNLNKIPGNPGSEIYWSIFYPDEGKQIDVTVPVGLSTRITRRDIYRQVNSDPFYYVGSIYDNTSTLYTDNMPIGTGGDELTITTNNTAKYFDDSGATITYETGIGANLKFNAINTGDNFYYQYEQDLEGNTIPESNQILHIKVKNIDVVYQE